MKKIPFYILILFLKITPILSFGQFIPVSPKQSNVYSFLNELNSEGFINADLSVTPLSRNLISDYLTIAPNIISKLNKRQQEELYFYQSIYNVDTSDFSNDWTQLLNKSKRNNLKRYDMFYYHDSVFTFSLNPIIGYSYQTTNSTVNYKRRSGASAYGTIKNWSLWVNLRDNYRKILTNKPNYLTSETGASIKPNNNGGGDFEEINGGIAYSNKWVIFSLMKDFVTLGKNLNGSNILSDRAPSMPMIFLQLKPAKWVTINYIHAWLVSDVIDSSQSFNFANGYRTVMSQKYLASNYITFKPHRKWNVSIGNSIVYSDIGIQPAYLIPVMFYKAVDHSLNGMSNFTGQNAQMFGSFSTTVVPHTSIYSSLYFDELSIKNMTNKNAHSNFYSLKTGAQIYNFPLKNLSVCLEYTRTNPITYNHFIPTTTYASNDYTLGNYLKDNSEEIWISATYQYKRIDFTLSYLNARHGEDYPYTGNGNSGLGLPFIDKVYWNNKTFKFEVISYLTEYLKFNCGFSISNIYDSKGIYTPSYLIGRKNTLFFGLNYEL